VVVVIVGVLPDYGAADEIPDGARVRALRELEEWWKPLALQNPAMLGLDRVDVDVHKAVLGSPYVLYILHDEDSAAYVKSDEVDPRAFAAVRWYVFPIYVADMFLGSLRVCRNVDSTGKKLWASDGEYTAAGASHRNDKITLQVLTLRKRFPGLDVASVEPQGSRIGTFCLLTDANGHRYVANDVYDGAPLSEVAPSLKHPEPIHMHR